MAQPLNQILTELNSTYQPQKDQYNQAIQQVDPQMQADQQGLDAAKQDAFSQIDQNANRRGMFYAGMPIAEEQKYTGANYLPAVANLHAKYAQQKFDLTNALNKVNTDQYTQAQGIMQHQQDQEEQQRQFDARLAAQKQAAAASSNGFSPSLGDLLGANSLQQGGYGFNKKAGGSFSFVDPYGNPVSAAKYYAATGGDNTYGDWRTFLSSMANQGDNGAKQLLGFVGKDFKYDPSKIAGNEGLYNSFVWGTPLKQAVKQVAQQAVLQPQVKKQAVRQAPQLSVQNLGF